MNAAGEHRPPPHDGRREARDPPPEDGFAALTSECRGGELDQVGGPVHVRGCEGVPDG